MRKSLLFFLLMSTVFMAFSVMAVGEEKIYENWKFPGETIIANDFVISYSFLEDPDKLRLRYDDNYKTFDVAECILLAGTNDTIRVCYDRYEYDLKKSSFKAFLKIYSLDPEIKVTRTFDKRALVVGEEIEVNVLVENIGASTAYNIEYVDVLEDFDIFECHGCKIDGTRVFWSTRYLNYDDYIEFSYKVVAVREFESKLAASFEYDTLREHIEENTKVETFEADSIIVLDTKLVDYDYYARSKDNLIETGKDYTKKESGIEWSVKAAELKGISTGDEFKMIVELTNNKYKEDDPKVTIDNVEIRIPPNFVDVKESSIKAAVNSTQDTYVKSLGLKKLAAGLYSWSGWIDEHRKYIILSMKATLTGHPSIYASSDYTYEGKKYSIDDIKKTIEVYNVTPAISIGFEKRDPGTRYYTKTEYLEKKYTTESGKLEVMKIRVDNPSMLLRLRDIKVKIMCDIFPEPLEYSVAELVEHGSKLVDTVEFVAPSLSRSKTYDFDIEVNWRTEFGEQLSETFERSILVESIDDIQIKHKFSTTNIESGQEFYVTTSLKNTRPTALYNVTSIDNISAYVYEGGITSTKVDIKSEITLDVYKYRLMAPDVLNRTTKCINTTVRFVSGGSEYINVKEYCLSVKPKKIDLLMDIIVDEPDVYVGELFDVDFTIRNRDEKSAFNISFIPLLQKDFDVVTEYIPFKSLRLDEEEKWFIERQFRIRSKVDEKWTLLPITIFYQDSSGNDYNFTSKRKIVKIKNQKVNTPMLMINKTLVSDEIEINDTANITLVIKNIGQGVAQGILVKDGNREWVIDAIGTNSEKIIKYTQSFDFPGEYNLGYAEMKYTDNLWEYLTASESVSIEVFKEAEIEEELNITVVEEEEEVEEEDKKNIFERIIDWAFNILFWTKE